MNPIPKISTQCAFLKKEWTISSAKELKTQYISDKRSRSKVRSLRRALIHRVKECFGEIQGFLTVGAHGIPEPPPRK